MEGFWATPEKWIGPRTRASWHTKYLVDRGSSSAAHNHEAGGKDRDEVGAAEVLAETPEAPSVPSAPSVTLAGS